MKIYDKAGGEIIEVVVSDSSYAYNRVMGENTLNLYFSLPEFVDIPVGSYCEFEGQRFTLERPENFTKTHSRHFDYTLILEGEQSKLGKYKLRNTADRRLRFSMVAKPHEFLQMLVDNLNARESGWSVGAYVEASEKLVQFNHTYIADALQAIAEAFKTEWEITGKVIHLRKVEYNRENPLALSYGRGNGFKSGIVRTNYDNSRAIEVLYVQGGNRNIDASKYGGAELLLPKGQRIKYDGRRFENEAGFDNSKAREYVVDAMGYSICRGDRVQKTFVEESLDCPDIYPKRVGAVTAANMVDEEKNFWDIADATIPETLNYKEHLTAGETMTIIFQTGMLTGRELSVNYYHDGRRFELVPQEIDGQIMPGGVYVPKTGDEYIIYGIHLPDDYICNNALKQGASWDMFREAVKYMYENEEQKYSFTGLLDGIWAKKNWLEVGGKIRIGSFIEFSDAEFQTTPALIRIMGVKRYVHRPYSPEIELSNVVGSGNISSDLRRIDEDKVVIEDKHKEAIGFTKRRFRDAEEAAKMLVDLKLGNFSGEINPVVVRAMQVLLGDKSLQFRFVTNTTNPVQESHEVVYVAETKVLSANAGIIQHMTIGIKSLSTGHAANEYKYWNVAGYVSPALSESAKAYYLYIKANKTSQAANFLLSEVPIEIEGVSGYYHLLYGILNSEFNGGRSFARFYGFAELTPGQLTIEKIASPGGELNIDLLNKIITGKMQFKAGSSGLSNLTEWPGVSQSITGAIEAASSAKYDAEQARAIAEGTYQEINDLASYVDGSFADGIIETTEAAAIEKYINNINESKAASEIYYNKVIVDEYLSASLKTALTGARNTLINATNNLITSINTAISDGATTAAEKANVDSKYNIYIDANTAYVTALENAKEGIQRERTKQFEYLKEAIGGSTEVQGGLVLSNMMMLKNLAGAIVAGMSGISGDNVFLFADENGGYQKALNKKSLFLLAKDGTANIGLMKVSKNSIAICEKLVDANGKFDGLGDEIVRFQDAPIPAFNDLITQVSDYIPYPGGQIGHSGTLNGDFGYSALLNVSSVSNFTLTINAHLSANCSNDYYTPIIDTFVNIRIVLYSYQSGSYVFDREVDTLTIYSGAPGYTEDTKSVNNSFGLTAGSYALRVEYIIQTAGPNDSGYISVSGVTMEASGSSGKKCLIFGKNGFVRIKDGNNYTYISDEMVAMKGLPLAAGITGSGQLYNSNGFLKVS